MQINSHIFDLRNKLQSLLEINDPPHALLYLGPKSAAEWFKSLTADERHHLVTYLLVEAPSFTKDKFQRMQILANYLSDTEFSRLGIEIDAHK